MKIKYRADLILVIIIQKYCTKQFSGEPQNQSAASALDFTNTKQNVLVEIQALKTSTAYPHREILYLLVILAGSVPFKLRFEKNYVSEPRTINMPQKVFDPNKKVVLMN